MRIGSTNLPPKLLYLYGAAPEKKERERRTSGLHPRLDCRRVSSSTTTSPDHSIWEQQGTPRT